MQGVAEVWTEASAIGDKGHGLDTSYWEPSPPSRVACAGRNTNESHVSFGLRCCLGCLR